MKRIVIRFRDLEDVVNHKPRHKTFWSRVFFEDRPGDKESALQELRKMARKEGFTPDEIIASTIVDEQYPIRTSTEPELVTDKPTR